MSHCSSRSLQFVGAALLTVTALTACAPDKGPGSAVVTYVIGNNKTCAEVGVSEVRATLFRGDFEDPTDMYSESVPCNEGEVEIDSVDPANYEVRVVGYDSNGVATFDNMGQIATDRTLEVFEAAESTLDSNLTARPAELSVRWRLNDGFDNCVGVGIDHFEVTAYQTGGTSVLLATDLDCELGGDAQSYRLVDDPDRTLNGALLGEASVQAVASDGSNVGTPAVFAFDPVGAGYAVQLTVECTEAGCSAG